MPNITERILLDIIKYPLITDKTTKLLEENQYCFAVDRKANKLDIKKAVEYLFNVKVKKVNTSHPPEKKRTIGKFIGKKPHYKKAVVTLNSEDRINLFPDN
uniref:ribosomal protein L23 n=1 Tax=Ahnfeltia fastigiata TaxID=31363 RepID=UPI001D11C4AC|nr:ribosomal protein L23 [Ahnfeltia fastigiata]UAT97667.1 ribosomal protein L23 [Ahnfeltia fastigiata]UAT97871.1 ribosomal protein L23 [Ahnfeltia fastigiata]